jgi:hypothetical protein
MAEALQALDSPRTDGCCDKLAAVLGHPYAFSFLSIVQSLFGLCCTATAVKIACTAGSSVDWTVVALLLLVGVTSSAAGVLALLWCRAQQCGRLTWQALQVSWSNCLARSRERLSSLMTAIPGCYHRLSSLCRCSRQPHGRCLPLPCQSRCSRQSHGRCLPLPCQSRGSAANRGTRARICGTAQRLCTWCANQARSCWGFARSCRSFTLKDLGAVSIVTMVVAALLCEAAVIIVLYGRGGDSGGAATVVLLLHVLLGVVASVLAYFVSRATHKATHAKAVQRVAALHGLRRQRIAVEFFLARRYSGYNRKLNGVIEGRVVLTAKAKIQRAFR